MCFTPKVSNRFNSSHKTRLSSTRDDSSSNEPVKIPRRDGMDRVQAGPNLTSSDLAGNRITRRDVTSSDIQDGADVEDDRQYIELGRLSSA